MSSSLNLLVDSMDDRYVVRVHRPHITPRRLGAIQQAQGVLLAGGVPCALPVPTLHGAAWVNLAGRLVEVEAYVDHDAVMSSWPRLEAGMALLARTPRFASHLEPADVAEAVRRGTDRIRGWEPTAAERRLAPWPRSLPGWSPRPRAGWSPGCPASWSTGTSGTTTCCSATGARCCCATSTSWASGPGSTTWPSRCGAPLRPRR